MASDFIVTERFNQHRRFLEDKIDPDFGLLDKLQSSGTLTLREINDIKDCHPFYKRNMLLLDYIVKHSKFNNLFDALRESNQVHVVNYFISNGEYKAEEFGDEWPLRKEELLILNTNQEVLVDLIEADDLIGQLHSKRVISKRQRDVISSKLASYEKNEALLENLRRQSLKDFKVTIRCLHESSQSHIAEILEQGGAVVKVHAEGLDDDTKDAIIAASELTKKSFEKSCRTREGALKVVTLKKGKGVVLYIYCKTVIQLMDLREMQMKGKLKPAVKKMFNKLLIPSVNQKVTVENLQNIVESMFTTLLHRSKIDEVTFSISEHEYRRCRSSFQAGIELRAVFDFDPEEMSEQQAGELNNIFRSKVKELEANSAVELEDLEISAAESEDAFYERLDPYKMALSFKKGDLMETILPEDFGDSITWWRAIHLQSEKIGYIPKRLLVVDYQTHLEYETSTATSQRENLKSATSKTSMSDLPFELLDSILQKVYLERVLGQNQIPENKDYHVFSQMASLDYCWFQRTRRSKFKKKISRSLLAYYWGVGKGVAIVKNNRNFFVNTIRPDEEFLNKLQSNNILAKTKRHYLDKLQSVKEKNLELLLSLNFHDKRVYSCFIHCLLKANQYLAAKVLDRGGVVAEAKVIFEKINSQEILEHLVRQLNRNRQDLFRENSNSYHSMMEKASLEILNSHQDRKGITIFLWCKTKEALDWLKRASESERLQEILSQVFSRLYYSVTVRDIIVDKKIFTKKAVCFSIVANFISTLNLRRKINDEEVMGVTKLRNKIHVLLDRNSSSAPRCVILVFEDIIPPRLQERIEIQEIKNPTDIASIDMENSLYVLSYGECVWKVKEEEKKEEIFRWLELKDYSVGPGTLSVTRDGRLLLVGQRKNDPFWSLRIFGGAESKEADLRLSISLPEDIQSPQHAVETSKGNFIIIHQMKRKKEEERGSDGGRKHKEDRMELIWVVSEVSDGKTILRRFIPKNEGQNLSSGSVFGYDRLPYGHLAVDSLDQVFSILTDRVMNDRITLLESDLQWNGILIPTEEDGKEGRKIRLPLRLFFDEEKKELIVGGLYEVFIYTVKRK